MRPPDDKKYSLVSRKSSKRHISARDFRLPKPYRMAEAEREQFLERFTPESSGIGFAVLGGSFGEGIDLPGARLIGAFIATLGLPQINPVNEQLRERMNGAPRPAI